MRTYAASHVAACIGENPYEKPCDIIETMWKRENPDGYMQAIARCAPADSVQKQLNDLETALTKQDGKDIIRLTNDTTIDTKTKVESIGDKTCSGLTSDETVAIKKHARSNVGTKHGTKNESSALAMYCSMSDNNALRHYVTYSSNVSNNAVLKGKVDAIVTQDDGSKRIVEIKNRTRRLFNKVLQYEYCQVQCYMLLIGAASADIAERYKDTMEIHEVVRNQEYINKTRTKLEAFDTLLGRLITRTDVQDAYFSADRGSFVDQFINE